MVNLKLSDDEFAQLMMALGYKTGEAAMASENGMVMMILKITNVVGKQVNGYIPYAEDYGTTIYEQGEGIKEETEEQKMLKLDDLLSGDDPNRPEGRI